MSVTYRDMSNNKTNKHQWIVLDGDIDAEWIESMNTVMDDNKMLTLASNERIPLTASMRLLLEINHMNHCSPATVSRGGVIYVNAEDVGWKPVSNISDSCHSCFCCHTQHCHSSSPESSSSVHATTCSPAAVDIVWCCVCVYCLYGQHNTHSISTCQQLILCRQKGMMQILPSAALTPLHIAFARRWTAGLRNWM